MSRARTKRPAGAPGRAISPYRSYRGAVLFGVLLLAGLMVGNVYLSVQKVRYGKEIQQLKREYAVLGSEVRDLKGRRASLTSLASIEQKAMAMGMVYPRVLPKTLKVEVEADDLPAGHGQPLPPAAGPGAPEPSLASLGGLR